VPNDPGCCVCGKSYIDRSRAMQKSTQQPSHDYERNADDGKHPVDAGRGWRLRASAEGRRDFRLPALPHADNHQQDNYRHGTNQHHERHRNQSIGQRNPTRHSSFGPLLESDRAHRRTSRPCPRSDRQMGPRTPIPEGPMAYPITWRTASSPSNRRSATLSIGDFAPRTHRRRCSQPGVEGWKVSWRSRR
jgi:hypothetical protein